MLESSWIQEKAELKEQLKSQAYDKFITDETAKFPYTLNKLGMAFVG